MTPSTAQNYPPRGSQLFYELARDRLNTQLSIIDALDNKIGLLVGLASGLLGILAAVFALRATVGEPISAFALLLLAAEGVAYVVVAYFGIKALKARNWFIGPELWDVWETLWTTDDEGLARWQVANDFWAYWAENLPAQKTKADALPIVFVAVVIQSGLLALALFLVAAGV